VSRVKGKWEDLKSHKRMRFMRKWPELEGSGEVGKCIILIPTDLPTYQHFKWVPTKPHLHGYTYIHGCHCNRLPQLSTTMRNEQNEGIAWSLLLFIQPK
jgi:hypothetical protein